MSAEYVFTYAEKHPKDYPAAQWYGEDAWGGACGLGIWSSLWCHSKV